MRTLKKPSLPVSRLQILREILHKVRKDKRLNGDSKKIRQVVVAVKKRMDAMQSKRQTFSDVLEEEVQKVL